MLSIVTLTSLFVASKSCSLAISPDGTYYISDVNLLDDEDNPDEILLTIQRAGPQSGQQSPFTWTGTQSPPWCKVMNINTGAVGNIVDCDYYKNRIVRFWAGPDVDEAQTNVTCVDNCAGSAVCTINRLGKTVDVQIPYFDTGCDSGQGSANTNTFVGPFNGKLAKIFNVYQSQDFGPGQGYTFIIFKSKVVAIAYDDSQSPWGYSVYDVSGDVVEPWTNTLVTSPPSAYPYLNVLQTPLQCCLCYGYRLASFTVTRDDVAGTMNIKLDQLGVGGGKVDVLKKRVYNWGLGQGQSVTVYNIANGTEKTFEPNLCDVEPTCNPLPCSTSSCAYNTNAVCKDDNCGGCNARWYCGEQEITYECKFGAAGGSTDSCATTTTTTTTTTTAAPGGSVLNPNGAICYQSVINILSLIIFAYCFLF